MKAGSFNFNEYLERLHEQAESKPDQEGLIIPDENKKSYAWLKKEYQKGKTEVKVEMKLGNQKFEPGYDLQTNLKSVKEFKPGMFGDAETSDTEGSKKKDSNLPKSGSKEMPKDGVKGAAKEEAKGPVKKAEVKTKAQVKNAEVEKKEDEEKEEEGKEKKDFKKKVTEAIHLAKDGVEILEREALSYLRNLPMTRKAGMDDLHYAKKIKVDPQLDSILENLAVVDFDTYEDFLGSYGSDFPYKSFFIANILEEEGVSFLVDPSGYDNARYVAELV